METTAVTRLMNRKFCSSSLRLGRVVSNPIHHGLVYSSFVRYNSTESPSSKSESKTDASKEEASSTESTSSTNAESESDTKTLHDWEDDPDWNITKFSELPHREFGYNQHMMVNAEFKESLRQILWQFRAPIRYAFAYGSGVFSQSSSKSNSTSSPHPNASAPIIKWQKAGGKVIDFIFGVSHTEHWHSLNMQQHPDHYSSLRYLGSGVVSQVQDNWGAGVYFNPYIIVNGTMIKYGVVNLDTLARDLSEWDTLYLAGRLQKPVKILRDDPKVRLANQVNLISALRAALLMLGPKFTERQLYSKIAGISYMGDPRMDFSSEDPNKVRNIVSHQAANFRMLYAPLVEELPNVAYTDPKCSTKDWQFEGIGSEHQDTEVSDCTMEQDMDPIKRGNALRRLPTAFRNRIYYDYRGKWQIPGAEYNKMMAAARDEDEEGFKRRLGSSFDRRIAGESDLQDVVAKSVRATVRWPSWSQSVKGFVTAGFSRSWKYMGEKRAKGKVEKKEEKDQEQKDIEEKKEKEESKAGDVKAEEVKDDDKSSTSTKVEPPEKKTEEKSKEQK